MPTIVRRDGFRIKIFGPPREHPPPHVHVYKGGEGLVIIRLGIRGGPPRVWSVYDLDGSDVLRAFRLVEAHASVLQIAWEKIHG